MKTMKEIFDEIRAYVNKNDMNSVVTTNDIIIYKGDRFLTLELNDDIIRCHEWDFNDKDEDYTWWFRENDNQEDMDLVPIALHESIDPYIL